MPTLNGEVNLEILITYSLSYKNWNISFIKKKKSIGWKVASVIWFSITEPWFGKMCALGTCPSQRPPIASRCVPYALIFSVKAQEVSESERWKHKGQGWGACPCHQLLSYQFKFLVGLKLSFWSKFKHLRVAWSSAEDMELPLIAKQHLWCIVFRMCRDFFSNRTYFLTFKHNNNSRQDCHSYGIWFYV